MAQKGGWNGGTIRIVGFFGGSKSRASWADMDIAFCTIEKVSLLDPLGPNFDE